MNFTTDYKLEKFIKDTDFNNLPPEVKERLKGCLLDLIGALIAGAGSEQFKAG